MAALRAGLASDAELIKAGWRSGSKGSDVQLCARVMGRLSAPVSLATERCVLQLLEKAVQVCVAAYPASTQADRQELQQLVQQQQQQHAGSSSSAISIDAERVQIRVGVLRALISEKTALLGCAEAVAAWQASLEALAAEAGGGSGAQLTPQQLAAVYGSDSDDDDGWS
jgi:sRNA-binding carbon storage regulator CsrA